MSATRSKAALALLVACLAGCGGAAKSADEPEAKLVGKWTDPTSPTDNRFISLTLNADGTGVGVSKYLDETIVPGDGRSLAGMASHMKATVRTKTMGISWHADREHLFFNVTGSSDENELDYSINGQDLSYGTAGFPVRYVLKRAGD